MLRCDGCGYADDNTNFMLDVDIGGWQCPVCGGYALGDGEAQDEGRHYHLEQTCWRDGAVCGVCNGHMCDGGECLAGLHY